MSNCQSDTAKTDVCDGGSESDVEVCSVIDDEIPRYTLRADTEVTDNDKTDWVISFPVVEDSHLSGSLHPQLIEAALSYFVLSGARVSQMTRTYSDIDAVTRLLREKERDLELAAKIGQQLLERNKQIEERVGQQESELLTASETITQLRHELQLKSRLLQLYTNDTDEDVSEATDVSVRRQSSMELLQARVDQLQAENSDLRSDVNRISVDTEQLEIREQELVKDVEWELSDANVTINSLSDELAARAEESIKHQEEITNLLAQLVDLQSRCTALDRENEELLGSQAASRECQCQLTAELAELKQNYSLLQAMYRDAQQQIRRREKQSASLWAGCLARGVSSSSSSAVPGDASQPESLASELERSLHSLGSPDSGLWPAVGPSAAPISDTPLFSQRQSVDHIKSVFDTVRYANRATISAHTASTSTFLPCHVDTSSSALCPSRLAPPPPDVILSASIYQRAPQGSRGLGASGTAARSGGCRGGGSLASGVGSSTSSGLALRDVAGDSVLGAGVDCGAGVDSNGDRASVISESDYSVDLDESGFEHNLQQNVKWGEMRYTGAALPSDCYTPDSWSSLNSTDRSAPWRLSEKLQIVKPVTGSPALQHWSRLATPHLGSLLEHRSSGIITSRLVCGAPDGRRRLNSAGASDESDSDTELGAGGVFGGRLAGDTSGVYTFTNSTVLHPEQLLPAVAHSRSVCTSTVTSTTYSSTGGMPLTTFPPVTSTSCATATPSSSEPSPLTHLRPRLATSTFSTSRGLARALHERGAMTTLGQTSGDGLAGSLSLGAQQCRRETVSAVAASTGLGTVDTVTVTECATPANSRCHSPEPAQESRGPQESAGPHTPQPQSIVQGLLSAGYGLPLGVGDLLRRALFSVSDCVPASSSTSSATLPVSVASSTALKSSGVPQHQKRQTLRLNRSVRRQMSLLERLERLGLQEAVAVIGQPPPLPSLSSPLPPAASQSGVSQSSSPAQQRRRSVAPSGGVLSRRAAVGVIGHLPPALGTVPAGSSVPGGFITRTGRPACIGRLGALSVGRKGGFT